MSNESLTKLFNLIKENPGRRVVPLVDSDVVIDDGYSYWLGSIGEPSLDDIYISKDHIYLKSIDKDEVVEQFLDDHYFDEVFQTYPEKEQYHKAKAYVISLSWEPVIVVPIHTPEDAKGEKS